MDRIVGAVEEAKTAPLLLEMLAGWTAAVTAQASPRW